MLVIQGFAIRRTGPRPALSIGGGEPLREVLMEFGLIGLDRHPILRLLLPDLLHNRFLTADGIQRHDTALEN